MHYLGAGWQIQIDIVIYSICNKMHTPIIVIAVLITSNKCSSIWLHDNSTSRLDESKSMKIMVGKLTISLFRLLLLLLLVFMVSEQLKIYIENNDVSSLSYKKFKHHHQDSYPTFSICVVLYDGVLFEKALTNSSKPYWNFIREIRYSFYSLLCNIVNI